MAECLGVVLLCVFIVIQIAGTCLCLAVTIVIAEQIAKWFPSLAPMLGFDEEWQKEYWSDAERKQELSKRG